MDADKRRWMGEKVTKARRDRGMKERGASNKKRKTTWRSGIGARGVVEREWVLRRGDGPISAQTHCHYKTAITGDCFYLLRGDAGCDTVRL